MKVSLLCGAVLLAVSMAGPAASPAFAGAGDESSSRAAMGRALVEKWSGYVERVYGVPAAEWAARMQGSLDAADPGNLRLALQRDTFEGALAQVNGTGHRLTDEAVVEKMAAATRGGAQDDRALAAVGIQALGSTTGDLVYTAVTPCRILDTRVVGGAIAANSTRSFLALAANAGVDFTSQGGSNTNCGVASVGASAVVINLVAVTPSSGGYATAYPYGASQPLAASINYSAGAVVNNTVIVGVPNPLTIRDFTVYSFAQAHYVADIVGYFSPPGATELECVNTSVSTFSIGANSINFFNNPACPAGYKPSTPYCWTAATGVYSQGSGFNSNNASGATFCAWQNTTGASQTVYGGNVCCRVPGR